MHINITRSKLQEYMRLQLFCTHSDTCLSCHASLQWCMVFIFHCGFAHRYPTCACNFQFSEKDCYKQRNNSLSIWDWIFFLCHFIPLSFRLNAVWHLLFIMQSVTSLLEFEALSLFYRSVEMLRADGSNLWEQQSGRLFSLHFRCLANSLISGVTRNIYSKQVWGYLSLHCRSQPAL